MSEVVDRDISGAQTCHGVCTKPTNQLQQQIGYPTQIFTYSALAQSNEGEEGGFGARCDLL